MSSLNISVCEGEEELGLQVKHLLCDGQGCLNTASLKEYNKAVFEGWK